MEQLIMISDKNLKDFESKLIKTNEMYRVLKIDIDIEDNVYVAMIFIEIKVERRE